MTQLRIVGVSASPRHGNTELMVRAALDAASGWSGAATQLISLAGKHIRGCLNCRRCIREGKCFIEDDWAETVRPLVDPVPDGVIFGSPVYFYHITSLGRAFLERCTSLVKKRYFPDAASTPPDWSRTVAAALAVGYDRNGGQEHTITDALHWFLTNDFIVVGGGYLGYAGAAGWLNGDPSLNAITRDGHGMELAQRIGRRVAEVAALIQARGPHHVASARGGSQA